MALHLNDEDTTYEALLARLIAVVDRLENGDLALAEALALYEEGMALEAACRRLLAAAELRVQQLIASPEGVTLQPWEE
jgi:exodeoxyribonuclease VII small subunit